MYNLCVYTATILYNIFPLCSCVCLCIHLYMLHLRIHRNKQMNESMNIPCVQTFIYKLSPTNLSWPPVFISRALDIPNCRFGYLMKRERPPPPPAPPSPSLQKLIQDSICTCQNVEEIYLKMSNVRFPCVCEPVCHNLLGDKMQKYGADLDARRQTL